MKLSSDKVRSITARYLKDALMKAFKLGRVPIPHDLRGRDYWAVVKTMADMMIARMAYQDTLRKEAVVAFKAEARLHVQGDSAIKEGDYVKATFLGLMHDQMLYGYYAGGVAVVVKVDNTWRLLRGFNIKKVSGGNAKDRAASMRALQDLRRRGKKAEERLKEKEAQRVATNWEALKNRVLDLAKILKTKEGKVEPKKYWKVADQLKKAWKDADKQRHDARWWKTFFVAMDQQIKRL